MLFKDGVRWEGYPAPKEKKVFQIARNYCGTTKINGKRVTAPPLHFDLTNTYTFIDENGKECQLTYAESVTNKRDGVVEYNPANVQFHWGYIHAETNKPSLAFWLANHPNNPGSSTHNGKIKFYELDENKQAEDRIKAREKMFNAQRYLSDPQMQLSDKQLRNILKSYGEPGVDTISMYQVKDKIMGWIGTDPKENKYGGPDYFLSLVDSKGVKIMAEITTARDRGVIQYIEHEQKWVWGSGDSKGNVIRAVPYGEEPVGFLASWVSEEKTGVLQHMMKLNAKASEEKDAPDQYDYEQSRIQKMQEGRKRKQEYNAAKKEADEAFDKGEYEEAKKLYFKAIGIKGDEDYAQKRLEETISIINKAKEEGKKKAVETADAK